MNMWTGGDAGNRTSKRQERNPRALQEIDQRPTFDAVRMQPNINCMTVIPTHTIVRCTLTDRARGQRSSKCLREELLDSGKTGQRPASRSRAHHRRCTIQRHRGRFDEWFSFR